jgi:hypothetical protein
MTAVAIREGADVERTPKISDLVIRVRIRGVAVDQTLAVFTPDALTTVKDAVRVVHECFRWHHDHHDEGEDDTDQSNCLHVDLTVPSKVYRGHDEGPAGDHVKQSVVLVTPTGTRASP